MNNHPRPAYFLNLNLPQLGTWKKADYFSALVLTLVGVVSTILGGLSFGNKETAKDSKRFPISQFLLFFSMLLSLVSLILIKLRDLKVTLLLSLLVMVLIPLVLGVSLYFTNNLSLLTGLILSSSIVISILGLFLRVLNSISVKSATFVGPALVSSFCVGLVLISLVFPTYIVLVTQVIESSTIFTILSIIITGVFILLLSPWIYYHCRYFKSEKSYLLAIVPNADPALRSSKLFEGLLRWGSGIIVLLVLVACLLTCSINIYNSLEDGYSEQLVINLVLLFAVPVYIYVGLSITKAKIDIETKLYVFTWVYGILPLSVSLPVYVFFKDMQFVTKFCVVLPPFAMTVQSFLSFFSKPKARFDVCYAFTCLTVVFPLGFLYPLSDSGTLPWVAGLSLLGFLGFFPVALALALVVKTLASFCRSSLQSKLTMLKTINYYYPVVYTIMLVFTFGEAALLYFFCSDLKATPEHASILGMILFLPFIYTSSCVTLTLKITSNDTGQNSALKQKFQILSLVFCSLIVPITIILMFALEFLGVFFVSAMKSLCIGISLLGPLTIILLQIKFKLGKDYPLFPMLLANIGIWLFLVIPVCIVFPVSLSKSESSTQSNKYIGVLIVYLGLLIMIFVSTASIVYNAYKNKMIRDKLARKCVDEVRTNFKLNRIQASQKVIRDMYDRFAIHKFNEVEFEPKLVSKSQFDWIDASEEDKYFYFKEILTAEEVQERKDKKNLLEKIEMEEKKLELERKEKEKMQKMQKFSFWVLLRCFDEYPQELKFTPPKTIQRRKDVLKEFNIEAIQQPIPQSEFEGFILNEQDLMRDPFPNPIKSPKHPRSRFFENTSSLNSLKIDRSERQDWLKSLFRFLANEPNEISAEPWMSEEQFFFICRKGGVSVDDINDIDLRVIYIKSLVNDEPEILNENVFVEKTVPLIAENLFPYLDAISREKKLVVEKFFPCLSKSINTLMEDPEFLVTKGKIDSLQETLRRTFTFQAEAARSGRLRRSSTIKNLLSRTLPMKRYSIDSSNDITYNRELTRIVEVESYHYQEGKLLKCFINLGTWFIETGEKIQNKIFLRLQSFYSPPQEEDEDQEKNKENKEKEKLSEENILETPIKEWEDVCKRFTTQVKDIIQKDELQKQIPKPSHVQLNFPNILAIFFKVIEIIQLSSLGFKQEINWKFIVMPLALTKSAEVANSDPDENTIAIFWVLFVLSFLYGFLGYRSFDQVKRGVAGRDKDGKKVGIRDADFWNKRFLTIFGGGAYIFVVKYMMNIYACEFDMDPPKIPKAFIECYTSWHIGLMVSAFTSLMVYYPIATFLFPLMQFNDSDLDFKHKQTYLIVLAQAKLLISGFKVFLPYSKYYEYQLVLSSVVLFLIFIYTVIEKPCYEKRFNLWASFGYFFAGSTNFFAFLNVKLGGSDLVTLIYLVLVCLGLFVILVIQGKYYGFWKTARVDSIQIISAHRNSLIPKNNASGGAETGGLKENVSIIELDKSIVLKDDISVFELDKKD